MREFTQDNWYKWKYEGQDYFAWPHSSTQLLRTEYGPATGPKLSLRAALLKNARSTIDSFPGEKFVIMFSGGAESELILRSYLELGHPVSINLFRFENGFNDYDVRYGKRVCEQLGVTPNIIDFNLTRFYENDALDLMEATRCGTVRALPQMLFMDKVDGLPLYGSGDPRFYRPHADYSQKTEWLVQDGEYDLAWFRFAQMRNRPAIMQWLKWTPDIVVALTQLRWFKSLVNDEFPGKLGPNSTKLIGYREAYPDLIEREKRTGLELVDHLVMPVHEEWRRRHQDVESLRHGAVVAHNQYVERSVSDFLRELMI